MNESPLGTISILTRTMRRKRETTWLEQADGTLLESTVIRCAVLRQKFVKVSYHGPYRKRWRPLSRHWWETNVGPIPPGYQVFHRDGDSLNDSPDNLVLVRENRFALLFANNPAAAERRARASRRGVRRANKMRHEVMRSARGALFNPAAWYVCLHELKLVVWKPFVTKSLASDRLTAETIRGWLVRDGMLLPEWVDVLQGSAIQSLSGPDGAMEGYSRFVPDERPEPKSRTRDSDFAVEVFGG
jgi:hypothetical protein